MAAAEHRAKATADPAFGTHIREAYDTLKQWNAPNELTNYVQSSGTTLLEAPHGAQTYNVATLMSRTGR